LPIYIDRASKYEGPGFAFWYQGIHHRTAQGIGGGPPRRGGSHGAPGPEPRKARFPAQSAGNAPNRTINLTFGLIIYIEDH
jgi:hypothetical protein